MNVYKKWYLFTISRVLDQAFSPHSKYVSYNKYNVGKKQVFTIFRRGIVTNRILKCSVAKAFRDLLIKYMASVSLKRF